MLQITLHVPTERTDAVFACLVGNDEIVNLTRLSGASIKPEGDVIIGTAPREIVSQVLQDLKQCGLTPTTGSITIDQNVTVLSDEATAAAERASGAPSDAMLWSVVKSTTGLASEWSISYFAFITFSTIIAVIGLATSSSALIVGAMILGPEFGPLAHICVAGLAREWGRLRSALALLVAGFSFAVIATSGFLLIAEAAGLISAADLPREFERAIVSTTWLGLIVAFVAGAAGVLTIASAKGEALVGVLVSVTTIPAAAEMSLGLAFTELDRFVTGLSTLLLNLGGMVAAGAVMLVVLQMYSNSMVRARRRKLVP